QRRNRGVCCNTPQPFCPLRTFFVPPPEPCSVESQTQLPNHKTAMNQSGRRQGLSTAAKDLLVVCLGSVVAFALAIRFEAFERFAAWATTHDAWRVDDVVGVLVLLGFAAGVFSWRRWRALKAQIIRRQTAEESLHSLEEYRNLFQLANDAILILDAEATVLDVNDKACESYGIARDQFIGCNLRDITEDPGGYKHRLEQMLTDGKPQEFEAVHIHPDGFPINFLVNTSLIEYRGHNAILSLNRDITERKRAEEALRESEENFHRIVEISPDAIIVHRDGVIDFVNNAGVKMIGAASRSELIGKSVFYRIPPAYHEVMVERLGRLQQGEFPSPVEIKL